MDVHTFSVIVLHVIFTNDYATSTFDSGNFNAFLILLLVEIVNKNREHYI